MKKILLIAGTRPEAIKLAPLALEMKRRPGSFEPILCATGQHPQLLNEALETFGLTPDIRLANPRPAPEAGLTGLTGWLLESLGTVVRAQRPQLAIVQGDTATALAGAWAAYLERVPVFHLEAGLRSGNLDHPFPEEANRRTISILTRYHGTPTAAARDNLLREGIDPARVLVSGNTAIDALRLIADKLPGPVATARPVIGVTMHRRENVGRGIQDICEGLRAIAQRNRVDIRVVVHPNPAVKNAIADHLAGVDGITLLPPLGYRDFIALMQESRFLISDSGGVQEEAPALGRPVLVTRQVTERPEAITLGANRLVGTNPKSILLEAERLLNDNAHYQAMATAGSPYGDGHAATRICDWLDSEPGSL